MDALTCSWLHANRTSESQADTIRAPIICNLLAFTDNAKPQELFCFYSTT